MARLGRSQPFKPIRLKADIVGAATTVTGSLDATFDALTLSGTGVVDITATLSGTLGALTLSGTAVVDVTAFGSNTLGALTLSGAGTVAITGSATATFDPLTLSGTGAVAVTATMSQTLGALTLSGTSAVTNGPAGTLDASFDALTLSGTAAVTGVGIEDNRSKGGWDPYYYKRRNKRRSKPEEVQEFVSEVLNAPAPEEAEAAKIAALQYLAIRNTALEAEKREALSHALREINDFYRHVRDEIKRRQILEEEEDEIDLLLLS